MLKDVEKIHDEAMDILEKSYIAAFHKKEELAKKLKEEAYFKEREAAYMLLNKDVEPSRSILFRSAASLAHDLGIHQEAEKLVCLGLSGSPPSWVANELRDLYENINLGRHLELKGLRLSDKEFQVSLSGNDVGFGIAKIEDYVPRAETISKLIQRTAQRKIQKGEFSKRIPKAVSEKYTPYISEPRAASFAVTFKIAVLDEQIDFIEEETRTDVIKEVIECVELLQNDKTEELKERIGSQEYYDNFIGLCGNLLPDGDSVKAVGFTYSTKTEDKRVTVTKVREKLEVTSDLCSDSSINLLENIAKGDEITIRGILQVADKSKDKPEIQIKCKDELYRVRVPEGKIDDVVRPLWDKNVIMKGTKHSKTIINLEDIQEDKQAD